MTVYRCEACGANINSIFPLSSIRCPNCGSSGVSTLKNGTDYQVGIPRDKHNDDKSAQFNIDRKNEES